MNGNGWLFCLFKYLIFIIYFKFKKVLDLIELTEMTNWNEHCHFGLNSLNEFYFAA